MVVPVWLKVWHGHVGLLENAKDWEFAATMANAVIFLANININEQHHVSWLGLY
jgi:hypothetical protein